MKTVASCLIKQKTMPRSRSLTITTDDEPQTTFSHLAKAVFYVLLYNTLLLSMFTLLLLLLSSCQELHVIGVIIFEDR